MRCPVCRAENTQGPQCRRCRADLTSLFSLEEQRRQALHVAQSCVAHGEWDRALAIADGMDALRHEPEALRLLAVCSLMRRDFARAWQCYKEALKTEHHHA